MSIPHLRPLQTSGRRWIRTVNVSRPTARRELPSAATTPDPWATGKGAAPVKGPKRAKLAHLFLVRANLHQEAMWEEFLSEADDTFSVYVHPKWPENVTSGLFRDRIVAGLCPTEYGRVSIVQAELCLLRAAMSDDANQFFLMHSESCVPIRTFSQVYEEVFRLGRSWLNYHRGSMCRYSHIDGRAVPEEYFYKASQFFCLSRRHVERILANCDLTAWKDSWSPEEHYFTTALAMCGELAECAQRDLTFADWNPSRREAGWGPATFHALLPGDVAGLQSTHCLFARKFAADSDVSQYIRLGRTGQKT
jgi:Core-2/I-Branching enzyme